MNNLPDRLGDSDTNSLLKQGRAYGVAAAIAVGAIAYMSGGISGVVMGGAVASAPLAPAAAAAWFQEDWNYSSTADMWSNPNGWLEHTNSGTIADSVLLVTGLGESWGDGAMLDTLKAGEDNGNEAAVVGYDLQFPSASVANSRHVWTEVYIRFSSNWDTDQAGVGNADHKTVLWQTDDNTASDRISLKIGSTAGSGLACYGGSSGKSDSTRVAGSTLDAPNDAWDGTWHRLRFEADVANGVMRCWFDDTLWHESTNYTYGIDALDFIDEVQLGRTHNQAIASGSQWLQYGRVQVFIVDPGWS